MADPDPLWDAFVDALLAHGPVEEKRSRYAEKPAVVIDRREVAHSDGGGRIDIRVTAAGWRGLPADVRSDPAVVRDAGRRDWVELRITDAADLVRLRPLLAATFAANQ